MKNLIYTLLILTGLYNGSAEAQYQILPPPPGKAAVYFVRISNMGMAINFSYFDSLKLIGRFAGPAYTRYECDPGHHLFWARSENRDFVEADLEAGKVYYILADVAMGGIKAQVDLVPVNPAQDLKIMDRMHKLMKKKKPEQFSVEELASEQEELQKVVERGMSTYSEEQKRNVIHDVLTAEMGAEPD